MSRWEIILFVAAVYVGVLGLVRLMRARRERLMAKFREEFRKQREITLARQAEDDRRRREEEQQKKFEEMIQQKQREVA